MTQSLDFYATRRGEATLPGSGGSIFPSMEKSNLGCSSLSPSRLRSALDARCGDASLPAGPGTIFAYC